MNITKRLTRDKSYVRPKSTYQETMTNKEIADKLKDYKKVINILQVPINTHIRYFTTKDGKTVFRLGGSLMKIGENQKYVVLSNGSVSWSVQIANTQFHQKMSENELRNEMKKQILSDTENTITKEIEKENKDLKHEKKNLLKKIEHLTEKISFIEDTIKMERKKKK